MPFLILTDVCVENEEIRDYHSDFSVFVFTLTEIIKGGVKFSHNYLCYVDTIQWADIVNMKSNPRMEYPAQRKDKNCECSYSPMMLTAALDSFFKFKRNPFIIVFS